jgi:lysozyme
MVYQGIDDHGIDEFSGKIVTDWNLIQKSGIQMVYIKATEGVAYINPIMVSQYQGATAVGLLVGFYHFASTNNPIAEYQYFMSTISKFKQDLKPCLDYEIINTDYDFISQFMSENPELILYAPHSIANNVSLDIFDNSVLLSNVTPPSPQIPGNLSIYTIQRQLNAMTLAGLVADGILGPLTTSKIKQFEQIVGITVDGVWGLQCTNATAQIYVKPLCGLPYHHVIPTRLIQFRVGTSIDGIFGPITANKVKAWQKSNGLVPDGIFGPLSWGKLLK